MDILIGVICIPGSCNQFLSIGAELKICILIAIHSSAMLCTEWLYLMNSSTIWQVGWLSDWLWNTFLKAIINYVVSPSQLKYNFWSTFIFLGQVESCKGCKWMMMREMSLELRIECQYNIEASSRAVLEYLQPVLLTDNFYNGKYISVGCLAQLTGFILVIKHSGRRRRRRRRLSWTKNSVCSEIARFSQTGAK